MNTNTFLKREKYSLLLLIIVAGYFFLFFQPVSPLNKSVDTLCLFHRVTGLPCPVCGTGRGLVCLLHANFKDAFLFNPLSYLVLFLSILFAFLVIKDKLQHTTSLNKWMTVRVAFIYQIPFWLLLIANWIWNIQKGI